MARAIDIEKAIEIIEEKQKELCPVGRYGRNYVYGSDREKYDAWEEIIDALDNLPTLTPPNEWVSVEERLPEPEFDGQQRGFYLVALSNGVVKELMYEFRHYENMMFDVGWHETAYPVTHWMPLPTPPDKGNNVPIKAPNEPLTLDKKRVIAESCLHYRKSGRCGLNGYAPLDCPRCKEWQSNEQNDPLTLDELREINGEPIYVTTKNYGDGWCILNWHGVNKSYTYFSRTGTSEGMSAAPISAKTYGDLWIAYRRPPEGEK